MRHIDDINNIPPLTEEEIAAGRKALEDLAQLRAEQAGRADEPVYLTSTRIIRASRLGMCAHCEDLVESRKEMRDSTREEILLEIEEKETIGTRSWEEIFAEVDALERAAGPRAPFDVVEAIHEMREERDQQLDEAIFRDSSHRAPQR